MAALNDRQKYLVQSSFRVLAADVRTTSRIFYAHLFAQDPSLRAMFETDMESQGRKLMSTLAVLVNGLDDLGTLIGPIELMALQHVGYGVERSHYRLAEDSLLHTLEHMLGETYRDEIGAAWQAAYRIIESVILASAYGK